MYHLDRMEIRGFKSFLEKTEIVFPEKITAVVGPNGCGKSNISDAIHWVLGEQRVRVLRGESMQDVIFNGSEKRKPLGMAEVTLVLTRDPSKPLPSTEPDLDDAVDLDGEGDEAANAGEPAGAAEPDAGDAMQAVGGNGHPLETESPPEESDEPGTADAAALSPASGNGSGERALEDRWPERIAITRRLFRSGESEYRLDGARCRLRDVQDLLRRIAVGSGVSTIIEQGKIAQMVSSRPKERRILIEEAAGIAGFKAKKREASLKLDATEANLVRLEDIIAEVRRQINSLKRQASKARRYQRLADERRRLTRIHLSHRLRHIDESIGGLRGEMAAFQDREAVAAAGLARAQSQAEELRARLEEGDRELTAGRDTLHALDLTVDREERGVESARGQAVELRAAADRDEVEAGGLDGRAAEAREEVVERERLSASLGAELERLRDESAAGEDGVEAARQAIAAGEERLEELRGQQLARVDSLSELRGRLARLDDECRRSAAAAERALEEAGPAGRERQRLAAALDEMESARQQTAREVEELQEVAEQAGRRIAENRQRLDQVEEQRQLAREELTSLAERLHSLEALDREESPQGRASEAAGPDGRGIVADFVEPAREIEAAAEVYLEDYLPAVVVEDGAAVLRSVERIEGGSASFLVPGSGHEPAPLPPELADDPRVLGRLSDRLEARRPAVEVVRSAADRAIVVRDLGAALELSGRFPERAFVTPAGEVVRPGGLVQARRGGPAERGILALRRRIQETRQALAAAEGRARDAVGDGEKLRGDIEVHEERAREATARRADLDVSLAEMRERTKAVAEQHEQTARLEQVRREEAEARRRERDQAGEQRAAVAGACDEAEAMRRSLEDEVRQRASDLEAERAELGRRLEHQAEVRTALEGARARHEALAQEVRHHADAARELGERAEQARRSARERRDKATQLEELAERTERTLRTHLEERREQRERLEQAAAALEEVRSASNQRMAEARGVQKSLEEIRGGKSEVEVALTRAESERDFMDRSCREDLGQSMAEAVAAVTAEDLEAAPEEIEARLAEVRGKIDALGPVNVMAVDEFTELEERYRFLLTQEKDLKDSVRSLKETIARINRQSRERFRFAFEQVRANFSQCFRNLFGGGRADLLLEEGDDVLECGVDITAQPPGKRLQRIALLSGGEKALTALAVLFAIFRFRPSPFCFLDEADAPLDEANIQRYNELVRRMADDTQFVLITHNKRTMESCDVLYGVTMEEPGVSRLVSVSFSEARKLADQSARPQRSAGTAASEPSHPVPAV